MAIPQTASQAKTAAQSHGLEVPVCPGHGQTAKRTVSKTPSNNGRAFYSCAFRPSSCDYFRRCNASCLVRFMFIGVILTTASQNGRTSSPVIRRTASRKDQPIHYPLVRLELLSSRKLRYRQTRSLKPHLLPHHTERLQLSLLHPAQGLITLGPNLES